MANAIVRRAPGPIEMVTLNMSEAEARELLEFIDARKCSRDGPVTAALRYALHLPAGEELLI